MAKTQTTILTHQELLASARGKKTAERTEAERAAVAQHREDAQARQQERLTESITAAVGLNQAILSASNSESIADRIEGLRDALVRVEVVRSEVANAVKSKAFRASVDVIINQARETAQAAWASAMDEIRALELGSE